MTKVKRSIIVICTAIILLIPFSVTANAALYNVGGDPPLTPYVNVSFVQDLDAIGEYWSYSLSSPVSSIYGMDQSTIYSFDGDYFTMSVTPGSRSVHDQYLEIPYSVQYVSGSADTRGYFLASDFYINVGSDGDVDDSDALTFGFMLPQGAEWWIELTYCRQGTDDYTTINYGYYDTQRPYAWIEDATPGVYYITDFRMDVEFYNVTYDYTFICPSTNIAKAVDPRLRDLSDSELDEDWISDDQFANYSGWIATGVSGFLDFEFIPGFTFGGLLLVLISFSFVFFFLKVFAGG